MTEPKSDAMITLHLFVGAREFMGQVDAENYFNGDSKTITVKRPCRVWYGQNQQMLLVGMKNVKEIRGHLTLRRDSIDGHLVINEMGDIYQVWQQATSDIVIPKKKKGKKIRLVAPGGGRLN